MIQKKICLIGAFAVGKTSLVSRYVRSVFSEKYHTTIGVKVDKKVVETRAGEVGLLIWDLAGQDDFGAIEMNYLRGASGYLLIIDGTRRSTLETAVLLQQRVFAEVGPVPFRVLVNKSDLRAEWEVTNADLELLAKHRWEVALTSALNGENVEASFVSLAEAMLSS